MDLGLAQLADECEGRLTRTRQFVGTLRYASPQQVLAVGRLDRRSDVYSLGATLWELLTLRPLFGATEQTPTPELMQDPARGAGAGAEAQPGGAARPGGDRPEVPGEGPDKRYATAAELARDLERFLARRAGAGAAGAGPERLWKWVRRQPTQAALIGMMIVAVVGLVVGAGVFAAQAEQGRLLAVQAKQEADKERELAEQNRQQAEASARQDGIRLKQIEKANEIITSVFHDLDPHAEEKEGLPLRAQLGERLDRAAELLEGDAVGDSLVVARLQMGLGEAQINLGYSQRAIGLFTKSRRTFEAELGPDDPDTLESMNRLAGAYLDAGQLDKALPLLEQVLEKRKAKLGPEHPDTLTSMNNLANALVQKKQYDLAVALLRHLLGIQSRKLPVDDPARIGTLALLGLCLLQADKPADAELILRECLALREKKLPDDWRTFNTKALRGGSLLGQKKYADAEPLLREGYDGMKWREKTIPPAAKPRLTEALERLVQLYEATDQKEKAAERRKELEEMKPAQTAPKP